MAKRWQNINVLRIQPRIEEICIWPVKFGVGGKAGSEKIGSGEADLFPLQRANSTGGGAKWDR